MPAWCGRSFHRRCSEVTGRERFGRPGFDKSLLCGVNALAIVCFLGVALGVLVCVQYEVLVGSV